MKNLFTFAAILCLFSACLDKTDAGKLTNTHWELTELPGLNLPTSAKATLNFGDSLKISGKSFCNNYGGQAEIVEEKIKLKNIFGTRMFCGETDAAERAYLQAVKEVTAAKIDGNVLELWNGAQKLLVYKRVN